MPFDLKNLRATHVGAALTTVSGLSPRKHGTFWHYVTTDSAAVVLSLGYFNGARDKGLLQIGDMITVLASHDATPLDTVAITLVVTNLASNVQVSISSTGASLYYSTTEPGTGANTTETALMAQVITGGLINHAGQSLELYAIGASAANGNNKTVRVRFGGTQIITSGAVASNNEIWEIKARITYLTNTSQRMFGRMLRGTTPIAPTRVQGTLTWTANNTLEIMATNGTANAGDFQLHGWDVSIIG
jgi:hypothetical protein